MQAFCKVSIVSHLHSLEAMKFMEMMQDVINTMPPAATIASLVGVLVVIIPFECPV